MDNSTRWREAKERASHLQKYKGSSVWCDETIGQMAKRLAEEKPDTSVFPNIDGDWSYKRIYEDALALARGLNKAGVKPDDVISFQTPNWPEAAIINVAAALGGFVISPIVIIYRHAEVRHMLQDSRSKVMFICESFNKYDFAGMMEDIRSECPDLLHVSHVRSDKPGNLQEMIDAGRDLDTVLQTPDPDDVKLLLYTSGTTGRPKAVLHSHNTLARASFCARDHWGMEPGAHILMPSPVSHVSGYANGLELPFLCDTRTVLMESWNAEKAVELIETFGVAGTVAATPFLQELSRLSEEKGTNLPSLKYFACGGAAVPSEIVYSANRQFAETCCFRVFGSSEAPLVTLGYQGEANADLAATTDGEAVDYEIRIVDDNGDAIAPNADGEVLDGEIEVRGPAMMIGYADAGDTAGAITPDGFFKTGDIGFINSKGALCISGRKKDLIIRGGENISAKEIEDVLHLSAAVQEAAVVSMPHERLGEGVCAFVILTDTAPEDPDDVIEKLLEQMAESGLAKQKRPEKFIFVDDFPRTASGKIRKDMLREKAKAND